jgi:glycine C-acetyltransferase
LADAAGPAEGQGEIGASQSMDMLAKAYAYTRPEEMKEIGLYPYFLPVERSDATEVMIDGRRRVMVGSNNYLGLTNDPRVLEAASAALKKDGSACTGSRLLNGNTDLHDRLETELATLVGKDAALVFPTGYQANLGVISALAGPGDVLMIDKLNHASMVDGAALSGAEVVRFRHADLAHLEARLNRAAGRPKMVIVDGVFSMEGDLAPLPAIVRLAKAYGALVFVDDSHAIGVCGATGRGTPEATKTLGSIDVITGTLGKAIGGAAGGYISGKKDLIAYLRQKSRPYTFSNSLPPSIVFGAAAAFDLLAKDRSIVRRLHENTAYFRKEIAALGFTILEGDHPIVPVMLGEAAVAQEMSAQLLKAGVYIKGLWFPVVPKGEARLRAQVSAALTKKDLDRALDAFERVGKKMRVI